MAVQISLLCKEGSGTPDRTRTCGLLVRNHREGHYRPATCSIAQRRLPAYVCGIMGNKGDAGRCAAMPRTWARLAASASISRPIRRSVWSEHEGSGVARMDSIRDVRIEERRLLCETRRLEAAWKRDPDYGTLRGRYKEEIYGRYFPPFDADHWALLDAPYGVLTTPEGWPDRLPYEVAYESVRMWAAQVFGPFADEWPFARWSADVPALPAFGRMLWPLPVGKQALQSAITRCSPTSPAPVADMMPFDGDEYAYLILRIPIRTSHVTMFGLAQPDDDGKKPVDGDTRIFRLCDCRFLLSSANPYETKNDSDGVRMRKVIGRARSWWMKRMLGQHVVSGGRPHVLSRDALLAGWEPYKDVCAARGERPRRAGFAAFLEVNRDTLSETLIREGLDIPPA